MPQYPIDPSYVPSDALLFEYYEATSAFCGWIKRFPFVNGMKLEVGDAVPSGEDPNFNVCTRCKRQDLTITKVPVRMPPPPPVGFWKIPTE